MAHLLFFGPLRDLASQTLRDVEVPSVISTVGELISWIGHRDQELGDMLAHPSTKIAVDQVIVDASAVITPASEIAFLPPMSGG
jgi:sulfur-carrier protein